MDFAKTILSYTLAFWVLAGCAAVKAPSKQVVINADHGAYPEFYQRTVQNFMKNILIEPDSAQYSHWKGPSRGWANKNFDAYHFGYRVCVDINDKNPMGAYTGSKLFFFVINNDQVVFHHGGYEWGTPGAENTMKLCDF